MHLRILAVGLPAQKANGITIGNNDSNTSTKEFTKQKRSYHILFICDIQYNTLLDQAYHRRDIVWLSTIINHIKCLGCCYAVRCRSSLVY